MNNKIVLISILILIISCNHTDNQNKATIDLRFLKTHPLNIENGKKIFNQSCITCHLYGTGGATILNDKRIWGKLLEEKTIKEIYLNVLNGYPGDKGPMPQKGACRQCSETDLFDAIEYILSINNLSIRN